MRRSITFFIGLFLMLGLAPMSYSAGISGTIRYDGAPVTNAVVSLWERVESSPGYSGLMVQIPFGNIVIAPNGFYSIDAVPGSNYVVKVTPDFTTGLLPIYYSGQDSGFDADSVSAIDGVPTTGIDFDLEMGSEISGIIRTNSTPASGIFVSANGDYSASTTSDLGGFYRVLVRPGTYAVTASPLSQSGWLRTTLSPSVSTAIGSPAENVDGDLDPAARISGNLFSGTNVVSNASVLVYGEVQGIQRSIVFVSVDDEGAYSVWVPPGSNYVVSANPGDDSGLLSEYYNDSDSIETAEGVAALVGLPAEHIDFDLERGAWIRGEVLSGTNAEWNARVNVQQKMFDTNTLEWAYVFVGGGYADDQGGYAVLVPPGSNYVVSASPDFQYGSVIFSTPGVALKPELYYDAAYPRGNASLLSIDVDVPAENVDFDLEYLPSIGGAVLSSGSPVEDAIVQVWQKMESETFPGAFLLGIAASSMSDSNGMYRVRIAPGSNYLVRASVESDLPFVPEYYDDVRFGFDADLFTVSMGEQVSNVNFNLSEGFEITGTVKDEDGGVFDFSSVYVWDSDGYSVNSTYDTMSGVYSLYAPTGELVYVSASTYQMQAEYFSNSWDRVGATPLSGSTGDVVTADLVLFRSDSDRDGDGLFDYQEEAIPDGVYSPGIDYSDLNVADTDQDGMNDHAEKISGTSPTDQADYLYISNALVGMNGVEFSWIAMTQVTYQVERCVDLSSEIWVPVGDPFDGADGEIQFLDPSGAVGQAFYRVRVVTP